MCIEYYICFFFQAEDGIRDVAVTGVQTCALPILLLLNETPSVSARRRTGLGRDRWRFVEQQHQDRQAQQANCGGPGKSANDSHEQTSKAHSFRRSCVTEPRLCETCFSQGVHQASSFLTVAHRQRQWIGQSFMPRCKYASSRLGSSPSRTAHAAWRDY